jgi:alpha-1,2-mannosyltransferase
VSVTEARASELDARSRSIRRVATLVFFGLVPLVTVAVALAVWVGDGRAGFDLRHAFLPAAHDVLAGDSPYPAPDGPEVRGRHAYVYTPVVAFATTPLTVLPTDAAVAVGMVGSFASVVAALLLAGVRDPRCYAVALVWPPVVNSAGNVAVSLPLAVLLAAAWRLRRHEAGSGAIVGAVVAAKSFAWPILAWPAVMGRWRSAATAVVVAVGLSLGTWAVIGFAGLRGYPELVRAVTRAQEHDSYALSSLLLEAGAGMAVARGALVAATAGLLVLALAHARRGREAQAFASLLLASLTATPLLWQHYLVVLLVALAVTRPRLSLAWLLPLVLYVAPMTGNGAVWQTALVPVVAAVVGVACVAPGARAPTGRPATGDGVTAAAEP